MNQFLASCSCNFLVRGLSLENSSPFAKFIPLTANIFWFFNFTSLGTTKFVFFSKSLHLYEVRATPKNEKSISFLGHFKFTIKKWKNTWKSGRWCKVPKIYLNNCFHLLSVVTTFVTASCILVNSLAVALFVLCECVNCSNSFG